MPVESSFDFMRDELFTDIFNLLLESGRIAIQNQQTAIVERKADQSLVTTSDLAISRMINDRTTGYRSRGHIFVDEEIVEEKDKSPIIDPAKAAEFTWYIDPIAGTTCYAAGLPFFAISIGVFKNNVPYMGGVILPAFNELYISDGHASWCYKNPSNVNDPREQMTLPPQEQDIRRPIFTHSSTRVMGALHFVQKEIPFVSIPTVNVGLMWTALGRLSASVIQLKLWDFAGAWAIFNTMGLRIRELESGKELTMIGPNHFDAYSLKSPHIITPDPYFDRIRDVLKARGR